MTGKTPGKKLERIIVEDDELFEETLKGRGSEKAFIRERFGKPEHQYLPISMQPQTVLSFRNEVQLRIEKAIDEFSLKEGHPSYGFVMDALDHIRYRTWSLRVSDALIRYAEEKKLNPETINSVRRKAFDLVSHIKLAIKESSLTYNIEEDAIIHYILPFIDERYRSHVYCNKLYVAGNARGKFTQSYGVLWRPWFKKLYNKVAAHILPFQDRGDNSYLLLDPKPNDGIVEDDLLLEDVIKTQINDYSHNHVNHPAKNTVQLRIEKAILNFCLNRGFLSFGIVMDAMDYIMDGHQLHMIKQSFASMDYRYAKAKEKFKGEQYGKLKHRILDLSGRIEDALIKAVSDYDINKEDSMKILIQISQGYKGFSDYGLYGIAQSEEKRDDHFPEWRFDSEWRKKVHDEPNPYDVLWEPWFRNLHKKFWEARRFYEREGKKFLI